MKPLPVLVEFSEHLHCCQKSGLPLWCCLSKCRPWSLLPPTGHCPGLLVIRVGPCHTPFWDQVAPSPVPWRGMRGAGESAQLGLGTEARGQLLVQSAVRPASWQVSALRSSQVESRLLRIFRLSSFLPSSRGPRNWDA